MSSVVETGTGTLTNTVIDVEGLLTAIPGDRPAGESLQHSGVYDEIQEARREEDGLDQGEWKRETKVADWVKVATLASEALATQTKDLRICAWLIEALVKLYGFAGLRDGLAVMRGLHVLYWEHLYPEDDEGDLEARANAISWMDQKAAMAIREVALTRSDPSYSYNDWEQSNLFNVGPDVDSSTAAERRQRAAEENKITSEDWLRAKQSTPRAFYETIFAHINESWEMFEALDLMMDERFGRQTPGLGALKKSLDAVRTLVEKIVKDKRLLEPDAMTGTAIAGVEGHADGNGLSPAGTTGGATSGPVRTRQEAINKLLEVAAYFRHTEPHSPVSYLIERAVKWSQMPLESWLASVIKDHAVLESLRETLGVESAAGEE